jgi:hypothetical protein
MLTKFVVFLFFVFSINQVFSKPKASTQIIFLSSEEALKQQLKG